MVDAIFKYMTMVVDWIVENGDVTKEIGGV